MNSNPKKLKIFSACVVAKTKKILQLFASSNYKFMDELCRYTILFSLIVVPFKIRTISLKPLTVSTQLILVSQKISAFSLITDIVHYTEI